MINRTCTLIFGLLFSIFIHGQEDSQDLNKNFGLGFHLAQHQSDFGMGLNFTSPHFTKKKKLAVRLRANVMWHQHLNQENSTDWTAYPAFSLGLVSVAGEIGNFMRLYSEGGFLFLIPSDKFSSSSAEFGGYGIFGFEFFFDSANNYFIELGGIGAGAEADLVPGSPIYSNGLSLNVGFRYQF